MERGHKVNEQSLAVLGIADYDKYGPNGSYAFGRSIDHRTDPRVLSLLPKTSKESGSVVIDLVKWGVRPAGYDTTYMYGDNGNFYSRSLTGTYSRLRQVAGSSGNGLEFYAEDGFVYYPTDTVIGRYGPLFSDTPTFTDDFLGSEGGVPTNTNSLDFEASSSMWADAADSASLSQTGDITLEVWGKAESLPTVGNVATLIGKWDESGATKSYRMALVGVSGFFGDGSDGALTISTNTTDAPIDSTCSGTTGTTSLSATNASFTTGQKILIHQTRGSGAGTYQINEIASYTAGTITTVDNLNLSYNSTGDNKAQVLVLKQYSAVTVNNGITWTAKAWNGTVGGVLAFLCSGTITVNGTITASEKGFDGGGPPAAISADGDPSEQGEGTGGAIEESLSANGNGGGGGGSVNGSGAAAGGGGGGNGTSGTSGQNGDFGTVGGSGGSTSGTADLSTITFGGGGGGGGSNVNGGTGQEGGNGGGIICLIGTTVTVNSTASIVSNGEVGETPGAANQGGGGGGAGGSVLVQAQTATLGTNLINATGGSGGSGQGSVAGDGGGGGNGRVHIDYYTSFSGTSTPTLNSTQDDSLVTNAGHQLRLSVSDDGSTTENLGRAVNISTDQWFHYAVSWDASASEGTFYLDGVSQGTSTGSMTAIDDNASLLYIAANKGAAAEENFFDGKLDDVRLWSEVRTASQISSLKGVEVGSSYPTLEAYYELDNSNVDSSANSNTLTLRNSPTYSTDVPFSAPTTRQDLDQSLDTSGNTYTLQTSIDEGATHRQTFVPAKDPQKSVEVLIAAKGTGDWTVTVHDALNREIATQTVVNADLPSSGDYEFEFDTPWTPVIGASYHFHLTSTVADGTVTTTDANDLETVDFHTYYQFLVTDTDYHPAIQMLNFIAIGNGRYVAKYAADSGYEPHELTLPPGWKVRTFAKWRHYLAIGCWRGDNVFSYDQGIIFFWDGISETYNDYIDIPEGAINAMHSSQGLLSVIAGYQGELLEYSGGTKANKVKSVPKVTKEFYTDVMPGAMNMWQSSLRIGGPNGDSTSIERGVYTWDNQTESYPKALSYDYPISTGTRDNNVEIGMVLPVEQKLLISWKDNVSYGVDVVDPAGDPYTSGTCEGLIQDYDGVWKDKSIMAAGAVFKPLASGESVTIKYQIDRSGSWTTKTESTVDATHVKLPISKGRHKEVQIAVDLETTTTTSPEVLGFGNHEDLLASEERYLDK